MRVRTGTWVPCARRCASLVGPGHFQFLGVAGALEEFGWDGPQREKLWRYNQHYFDDLNASKAESRRVWHEYLLEDWVAKNPPPHGSGWEPYPTSLRIVNWIKWILSGNDLPKACEHSLAVQARWLVRRLEFHLLGNHLFANAKALVFAGLYFDGAEAQRWLKTGLRILRREVQEQVLDDGGHFERSTMYHALAVEDILDLCNLASCFSDVLDAEQQAQAEEWRGTVPRMLRWLRAMCHPDGEIAFFNDAALGIAPTPAELYGYSDRLGFPSSLAVERSVWLPDSGYARLSSGDAVVLLDVAPVGPDYLPGHAHADTLSFEMSLGEQRVLVNSGTSCYGASAERLRQRGTAAHNTVLVNGEDSSEVWSGFRVARRAYPIDAEFNDENGIEVSSAHDGFERLPGGPVHRRAWRLESKCLIVSDSVEGPHTSAEARYHLHPAVEVSPETNEGGGRGVLPDGRVISWRVDKGDSRIEPTTWHPRFGASESNLCIVLSLDKGQGRICFFWD
ncbi:alginate lyase family protein [Wenzhouxiangella sp. XN24]|uniref:heparinase II/III family protein n=1 Tax=Wenzhouxiangella sp. XN24 TaxID=2713569 RepID=UPI003211DC97